MSPASRPPRRGGPPAQSDGRRGRTGQGVIYEFTPLGGQVRVAAVDVASGREVVAFGPASATQRDLEQLALAKLRYVMGVKHHEEPDARPEGRGKLV